MQISTLVHQPDTNQIPALTQQRRFSPLLFLFVMECAFLLLAAVLPLRGLWFYNAFLETPLGSWMLWPTHLIFPGYAVLPPTPGHSGPLPSLALSWNETFALLGTFILLFLFYTLAVRFLPSCISRRYILISTALFGITCTLIPALASQDLFSYIAYARIGVLYHLNPLTTLPITIAKDPIYPYLYWVHQPSAYGPTWAIITCGLQWLALLFGSTNIFTMVLLLRVFNLAMHLGSVFLVWSISGHLQRPYPFISLRRRVQATLAFAWNPFLLFEACINAHNDTTILFLVLLALWFLVSRIHSAAPQAYLLSAATLALAACLKITFVLLAPGLLLFLWAQQPRRLYLIITTAALYVAVIILLYAPFWQHGAVLDLFQVSPAISRDINTPYEFLSYLYINIEHIHLAHPTPETGFPVEILSHKISTALFLFVYGLLCSRALLAPESIRTLPSLFRWLALVWLLYCLIGTPWFWPWYSITFFGIYALIEVTSKRKWQFSGFLLVPLTARLFAFCMLSLYCFLTLALRITVLSQLPHFQWAYFRGLWVWIWIVPVLALHLYRHLPFMQRQYLQRQKL